ncbi:MAG TPA: UDP-N-acetylmuramoyl-tripeptide--D-alanyl-D-alanine ligase [Solirubrobacteraceae bacterium]|nr:UDP-N-acetylmuramoyl-tripeptide--D-alanyl-D-alanine ligase [Solirubrobacteraceae bacterium]
MRDWTPQELASAAGADLLRQAGDRGGPEAVTIDSRQAEPGMLFVGLPGERVHGGKFATSALEAGAYGVLTSPEYAEAALTHEQGVILAAADPLAALQRLATAWRDHLGAHVIGVTGSTGKTSTKDLLLAVLSPHRATIASRANFNTEIGLPLEILAAPPETEVLVLEMGMRGRGQIAELAQIARPDVGIIVSIGPVHLELMGSIEVIAAAKAELITALPANGTAIVPAGEALLAPHLRSDIRTVTFGPGGDVQLRREEAGVVEIDSSGQTIRLEVDFPQSHLRRNLLAAVAAAQAVGVTPEGRIQLSLSPGRGQQTTLRDGVVLIEDCYNANPMSMRAALDDLTRAAASMAARRVAVLGDMRELGPDAPRFHAEIGAYASARADVLVTVGSLAAEMGRAFHGTHHRAQDALQAAKLVPSLLEPGDVVLVKGSRSVALEQVCHAVAAGTVA